jgi:tetratricopeptide (TPR) repeat protein
MKPQARAIHQPDGCPDALDLWAFAEGRLDPQTSEKVMTHVTDCAECGSRLRVIAAPGEEDFSADELAMIDNLPSARPSGRTALVKKMRGERWAFGPAMRIAAMIAGVGIVLGGFWYTRQGLTPDADKLIATAYTSRRPFAYRLTGGGNPGPVRIERASSTLTDLPREVVDALVALDQTVARRPEDPKLLSALGQAKLLAVDLPAAIETLERAHQLSPLDEGIASNLATALALESERLEAGEANRPLMMRSLKLLDDCLGRRPSDSVARFNRALVLKSLGRDSEAAADLRQSLRDEKDPAWRDEITRQLKDIQP